MYIKQTKLLSVVVITMFCLLLTNCSAVITPLPVGLYSNATFPLNYESPDNILEDWKVLGTVEGIATVQSFFGLVAVGDASTYAAYKNAISKFPEADCLLNVTIDYKATSFLGIVSSFTTIIRGKAIQSNRNLRLSEIDMQKSSKNTADNLNKLSDVPKQNDVTADTQHPIMTTQKKTGKQNLALDSSIGSSLNEFEARLIGKWKLHATKLPDGKLITPESGLRGLLSFDINKNVNLIFEQNGKTIEFEGTFYTDIRGATTIEVSQSGKPEPRKKIYYKHITINNELLMLKSESQKEYRWKKTN